MAEANIVMKPVIYPKRVNMMKNASYKNNGDPPSLAGRRQRLVTPYGNLW